MQGLDLAEVSPDEWSDDQISFRGAAQGDEQIASAFSTRGTLDGWKKAVTALQGHKRAFLPFYSSFAAALLEIIQGANFIVDVSNRTSTGKTTTLRAGASAWGNPDERSAVSVIGTWDATRVGIERTSSLLHGMPLLLDDTKRAKDPRVVADTLYAVASGRGKQRGNPRGIARTQAWRTILVSTGEAPATAFTQDGGTRTRVLSIRGAPFGTPTDDTRRAVDLLNLGVLANYGHAGPAFVRWLLENRSEWPKLIEMYQLLHERYASEANSAEGGRLAQYAAVISLTARLAHEALDLPWEYDDPLMELWAELAAASEDAAGDLRALRDAVSWAHSHEATFYGRAPHDRDGNDRAPPAGWSGRWDQDAAWDYLGFFPPVLDRVLKDLGYEPAAVLAGWTERGWLQVEGPKHRTKRVRTGGVLARVYAISRPAIVEADG